MHPRPGRSSQGLPWRGRLSAAPLRTRRNIGEQQQSCASLTRFRSVHDVNHASAARLDQDNPIIPVHIPVLAKTPAPFARNSDKGDVGQECGTNNQLLLDGNRFRLPLDDVLTDPSMIRTFGHPQQVSAASGATSVSGSAATADVLFRHQALGMQDDGKSSLL
jgi:hypothetical protein